MILVSWAFAPGENSWTRLLALSVTHRFPWESKAAPRGSLSCPGSLPGQPSWELTMPVVAWKACTRPFSASVTHR